MSSKPIKNSPLSCTSLPMNSQKWVSLRLSRSGTDLIEEHRCQCLAGWSGRLICRLLFLLGNIGVNESGELWDINPQTKTNIVFWDSYITKVLRAQTGCKTFFMRLVHSEATSILILGSLNQLFLVRHRWNRRWLEICRWRAEIFPWISWM